MGMFSCEEEFEKIDILQSQLQMRDTEVEILNSYELYLEKVLKQNNISYLSFTDFVIKMI